MPIEATPPASEAVLAVEGMHCARCARLIELRVGALPGILSVQAGLATHRVRARWQSGAVSLAAIIAAISRAGYRAWPLAAQAGQPARLDARRAALWRLFVAGFSMMQVMMLATPAYFAADGEMARDHEQLLRIASFVLTFPVMIFSATPFFAGAWRDLRAWRIGMDVPVMLGVSVAFGASTWATFVSGAPVYFDTVVMFVFFLLAGRHIEALARNRASSAIEELVRAQPAMAWRLRDYPASLQTDEVAATALRPRDLILLRSGESAPADGIVVAGRGLHDEALLTGEARAVVKAQGAEVIGGAINLGDAMVVRVTAAADVSRASLLARLVDSAANARPAIAQVADRHAAAFLWAILALALMTAVAWWWIDPARALPAAVAVLIVTCPCALSLAAPAAMAAATGNLARRGVLVTGANALERLARTTHFVFDKTGTLTTGRMRVERIIGLSRFDEHALLRLAARLEQAAVHPVARALTMQAAPLMAAVDLAPLEGWREIAGAGVEAVIDGVTHRLGSIEFAGALHALALPPEAQVARPGVSVAALASERGWLGVFWLGDGVRAGVSALVSALEQGGSRVALATGDSAAAAANMARAAGIDEVHAGMSPADKHDYIVALQAEGAIVAMVGDGINDAPGLARAQVAIAMGGGAPLAQTKADLVLMSGEPADLEHAVNVARQTMRIVRQNLWWAAAYNLTAIPLAALGMVTPWQAGLGMSLSSLVVVVNSLRLAPRRKTASARSSAIALHGGMA